MRDIKFRVWQKLEKRMYPIDGIYSLHFGDLEFNPSLWKKEEVLRGNGDEIVIMQFTGLLDKNGKEIWEGDILKNPFNEKDTPKAVYYNNSCQFVRKNKEDAEIWYDLGWVDGRSIYEVIGNIYENKELLNP